MDISGAQLNSVALNAYNAQLQAASQQSQQVEAPAPVKPSAEVTLSRDALESSPQNDVSASTQNTPDNRSAAASGSSDQSTLEASSSRDTTNTAEQARENESRQQSSQAAQSLISTTTYTASVASQSYYSVSNF